MKKQLCFAITAILLGGIFMTACDNSTLRDESDASSYSEPTDEKINLFEGCTVYCDGGAAVGNGELDAMTDGDSSSKVTLTPAYSVSGSTEKKLAFTDWNGNTRTELLDYSSVDFYIDIGFCAVIDSVKLCFDEYSGKPIKLFYSDDGCNFSYYIGEFDGYNPDTHEWSASVGGIYAKAIMFVLPIEADEAITVSSAEAYGSREHERLLLSGGAAYSWSGTDNGVYLDDGTKLTDGIRADKNDTSTIAAKFSDETDSLTGRAGSVITVDLGDVKNVSEVVLSTFISSSGTGMSPDRITARYSENGEEWHDLGQSYLRAAASARGSTHLYAVTRNHTVKARYIRVYTYVTGLLLVDEIEVYGCEHEVNEPDYGYAVRPAYFSSNTTVSSYQPALLNGSPADTLTDNIFSEGTAADDVNSVEITLKNPSSVAGIAVITDGEISDLSYTLDGTYSAQSPCSHTVAAGEHVYCITDSEAHKSAGDVKITFSADKSVKIKEVQVYGAASQLPYVRGGFFQLPTSGGVGEAAQNSDYSWYLQLKGMRDLGMEYVVIQYSTHYNAKTTLINGKRITAAGYSYTPTYGSTDVCGAVLDAAEKLGMKVWLGTIHDSDFTNPVSNAEAYKKIAADSKAIIDDIFELYGKHPAFAGYYLSDETCDQWLNLSGGVEAARYVYKSQSDRIREIAPDAKIMIAPAIWRSGDPEKSADSLYRLIVGERAGQRPIIDIVAAQDCLGRESTLSVTDSVYNKYMTYAEEWAKAVRRAGAEFWHDAEVFEVTGTQKRHEELLKSLTLEALLSGSIIVFDIPHYFSVFPMGGFNNEYDYFKRLKMREYVEYYASLREAVNTTFSAVNEVVDEDDGKTVEVPDDSAEYTPPKQDKEYNVGVLVNSAPDSIEWHTFAKGNTLSKAEYFLYWDTEALYVLLKTNDTTADFGKGAWWESKNDLVQLWISCDGSKVADASTSEYGVRYYINRTGDTSFSSGGEAAGKSSYAGFTFAYDDGVFTIKMPWKSLGRTVPEQGDGTAIGINLQYIDGHDSSWSSSTGNTGRSITEKELYSF